MYRRREADAFVLVFGGLAHMATFNRIRDGNVALPKFKFAPLLSNSLLQAYPKIAPPLIQSISRTSVVDSCCSVFLFSWRKRESSMGMGFSSFNQS